MKLDPIIDVPLLNRKWLPVGYAFFPLPIFILIGSVFINLDLTDYVLDIGYGCWAAGFLILNLTKEKIEDEMIKIFRLQAYHTGFFWLLSGMTAIVAIKFASSFWGASGIPISATSILFLLNAYIFFAFQYQKYIAAKDSKTT